jgi:hypothetical protein
VCGGGVCVYIWVTGFNPSRVQNKNKNTHIIFKWYSQDCLVIINLPVSVHSCTRLQPKLSWIYKNKVILMSCLFPDLRTMRRTFPPCCGWCRWGRLISVGVVSGLLFSCKKVLASSTRAGLLDLPFGLWANIAYIKWYFKRDPFWQEKFTKWYASLSFLKKYNSSFS